MTSERGDLRDPKIVVTPDGRLMLTAALAFPEGDGTSHQTVAWFSRDGREWTSPREIGEPNHWLWRVTWQGPEAYGIGYHTRPDAYVRLYRSSDGERFETVAPRLFERGNPNESALVFPSADAAICLLRRDGEPGNGLVGLARFPWTDWWWKELGMRIGGPNLIQLPDGRYLAAVRLYDGGARTSLAWLDPDGGTLREFLRLPSGGDTSYAGLGWRDGRVWVSYYSSHEGRTAIYLAQVYLPLRDESVATNR
jgi:hypothetical protein